MIKPKYKKWFDREILKGYTEQDLLPTIKFFDENPQKFEERDIYKWDGKALENHIKENSMVSKRKTKRGNYEKFYETDEFLLVSILDEDAAKFWGVGTKWCITTDGTDYFNQYRDDGCAFFFLIDKTVKVKDDEKPPANSKYAIVYYRNEKYKVKKTEYYNAEDKLQEYKNLSKRIRSFLEEEREDLEDTQAA